MTLAVWKELLAVPDRLRWFVYLVKRSRSLSRYTNERELGVGQIVRNCKEGRKEGGEGERRVGMERVVRGGKERDREGKGEREKGGLVRVEKGNAVKPTPLPPSSLSFPYPSFRIEEGHSAEEQLTSSSSSLAM